MEEGGGGQEKNLVVRFCSSFVGLKNSKNFFHRRRHELSSAAAISSQGQDDSVEVAARIRTQGLQS